MISKSNITQILQGTVTKESLTKWKEKSNITQILQGTVTHSTSDKLTLASNITQILQGTVTLRRLVSRRPHIKHYSNITGYCNLKLIIYHLYFFYKYLI